jgi:hypothetical protein
VFIAGLKIAVTGVHPSLANCRKQAIALIENWPNRVDECYGDLSTIVSALVAKGTKIKRVKNLSSSEVLRHWMLNTAIDFEVRLTDFFP